MSIFDKLFKRKRKLYSFEPDYVVRPSETIKEAMQANGLTAWELCLRVHLHYEMVVFLLIDEIRIDERIGKELSCVLGGAPEFWVALSKNYFDALKLKGGSDA